MEDPKLVRLDGESQISTDLSNALFTVKTAEKEGALLEILQNVACIPPRPAHVDKQTKVSISHGGKKRKRNEVESNANEPPNQYSTIVFVATKHRQYNSTVETERS